MGLDFEDLNLVVSVLSCALFQLLDGWAAELKLLQKQEEMRRRVEQLTEEQQLATRRLGEIVLNPVSEFILVLDLIGQFEKIVGLT